MSRPPSSANPSRGSLLWSSGFLFLFMALFNLTFVLFLVFENQLDLILQNALLEGRLQARDFQTALSEALGPLHAWSADSADSLADSARKQGISDLVLFQEDGTVLLALQSGTAARRGPATTEELAQINKALARKAFEGTPQLSAPSVDQKNLEVLTPFVLPGDRQGVARFLLPLDEIPRRLDLLFRQAWLIGGVLLSLHLAYALLAYRLVFSPLRRLLLGVRKVSQGDLEARISVRGRSELGELAEAFNEMGGALKRLTDEAKGANPLSGLPGNISIAREIDRRLAEKKTFAVLYSDLDNFKAYNDKYGFTQGDEAILYTRDTLVETAKGFPTGEVFLGHEGGDDFVVIVDEASWEPFCQAFLPRFDGGIGRFYNATDAANGYIESVNRQGVPMRFPLISISIAVVTNKRRTYHHHAQMVEVAAEVKKLAKKKDGSSYVEDLRVDEPAPGPGPAR